MQLHIRLDGNAKEISDAIQILSTSEAFKASTSELADSTIPDTQKTTGHDTDIPYVTTRFARRVLTRRPLSTSMRTLFQALYESHPDWSSALALHQVLDYRPAQLAGLMGAFGRRIANTEGFDSEAHFFDFRWNDEKGAWDYRLPKSVHEALQLEQLV